MVDSYPENVWDVMHLRNERLFQSCIKSLKIISFDYSNNWFTFTHKRSALSISRSIRRLNQRKLLICDIYVQQMRVFYFYLCLKRGPFVQIVWNRKVCIFNVHKADSLSNFSEYLYTVHLAQKKTGFVKKFLVYIDLMRKK